MTSKVRNTVYVVTGGNRGIGLGIVTSLLSRPQTTIVATVRTDTTATKFTNEMRDMERGRDCQLYITTLDFSVTLAPDVIREKFSEAAGGLDHIDVLICSAAYFSSMKACLETTAEDLRTNFTVNTIAPLTIFQALWPLMERKAGQECAPPKYIFISSSVGSIGMMEPLPGGSYGPSKAASNWIVKALHYQLEQKGLVSLALHPGFVKTDMGESAGKDWNFGPRDTIEDSVKGILKIVDEATRENFSGRFVTQNGEFIDW